MQAEKMQADQLQRCQRLRAALIEHRQQQEAKKRNQVKAIIIRFLNSVNDI